MTVLVKSTIKVQDVKVGDEVTKSTANVKYQQEVATVKKGTKWVTARDAKNRLVFEKELGTEIEIGRWELTEEEVAERRAEQEAEDHEKLNQGIERWATRSVADLEANLQECVQKIVQGYGDVYSRMMAYQAESQIAAELQNIREVGNKADRHEGFWAEFGPVGSVDWVAAYELWKRETLKKITGEYAFRADRRDAFEDVKHQVTLKVLHKGDYGYWS